MDGEMKSQAREKRRVEARDFKLKHTHTKTMTFLYKSPTLFVFPLGHFKAVS